MALVAVKNDVADASEAFLYGAHPFSLSAGNDTAVSEQLNSEQTNDYEVYDGKQHSGRQCSNGIYNHQCDQNRRGQNDRNNAIHERAHYRPDPNLHLVDIADDLTGISRDVVGVG